MASHGKVLDLLDDRYLDLQDVVGNIEPLPTLVPYEDYTQNVLVYRMDTDHEVFLGLVQDFTYRRAYEVRKELWTWLVQWEVDNSPPTQQLSSPKKVRLDVQPANALSRVPTTPRKSPALTIFERRTLDGALMLEEDMLRILIDIVQVASSLVPNFIEFLYRWVDYYEGDGKALKAALRCEIPSLWDFEYHPLVLPQDRAKDDGATNEVSAQASGEREERARSASASKAAELRQSSPTKKMHARPKPDLAAIELQTFYSEESERLQYREVKFGIQPPKLEEPLPPLINIPRDIRKRTKYYAACHRSRQRALYLLLEAGVTMRQINNYQKLQTAHPRETLETGDGNGLRNYQKDAKYAQAHYELEEKQIKQREISISNKLAVEAQLAATHAIPDGAAGLPLIPPTPSCARKPGMAAEMMQRIKQTRTQSDEGRINIVPRPLLGLMKSRMFEGAQKKPELRQFREMFAEGGWYSIRSPTIDILPQRPMGSGETTTEDDNQEGEIEDGFGSANNDDDDDTGKRDEGNGEGTTGTALSVSTLTLPRPTLPMPVSLQSSSETVDRTESPGSSSSSTTLGCADTHPASNLGQSTPASVAAYMQNLSAEQAQRLLPLLSPQARQAASTRLQQNLVMQGLPSRTNISSNVVPAEPASDSQLRSTVPHAAPVKQSPSSQPPLQITPPSHQASQSHYETGRMGIGQTLSSDSSSAAGSLMLPRQRPSDLAHLGAQSLHLQQPAVPSLLVPSSLGLQRPTTERGRIIPAYALSPMTAQPSTTNCWPPAPVSPSFDPNVFMRLRRQQEAANSITKTGVSPQPTPFTLPAEQLVPQPSLETATGLGQQTPAQRQRMLSETFNTRFAVTQTDLQAHNSTEVDPNTGNGIHGRPTLPFPSPASSSPTPPSIPPHPKYARIQEAPVFRISPGSPSFTPSSTASAQPPSSEAMLPPPHPGIARNAPSPLTLSLPKPSPFNTLAPQIFATSPFLAAPVESGTPIQVYIPRIIAPGNGIGPGGTRMGDGGSIETDALMLGHENIDTGKLVLTKAILLPVGVWENTLRKVRNGRWSVLETYACPASHPASGKGKGKAGDEGKGCHKAVYDKLVQAYSVMSSAPTVRENELTKRWRTSRGPMTSSDRGAVWEGWGVYVDREIEMSVEERRDAMRKEAETVHKVEDGFAEDYGPYSEPDEALRRRREMEELMDEDEDEMDG